MATATCAECGEAFTRTCSCQGNLCPRHRRANSGARASRRSVNGRAAAGATVSTVKYRVTYRDDREPELYDTAQAAADARAAARAESPPVRSFLRTVRMPVEAEAV